jgi:hypothetical protein
MEREEYRRGGVSSAGLLLKVYALTPSAPFPPKARVGGGSVFHFGRGFFGCQPARE